MYSRKAACYLIFLRTFNSCLLIFNGKYPVQTFLRCIINILGIVAVFFGMRGFPVRETRTGPYCFEMGIDCAVSGRYGVSSDGRQSGERLNSPYQCPLLYIPGIFVACKIDYTIRSSAWESADVFTRIPRPPTRS
jgi:hypothetical protein